MSESCKPDVDFLRHIANPVINSFMLTVESGQLNLGVESQEDRKEITQKLISSLLDLRKGLINAEIKYNFSIYNGNPENIANYIGGAEWRELVEVTLSEFKDNEAAWKLMRDAVLTILNRLAEKYSSKCPTVAKAAADAIERLPKEPPKKSLEREEEAQESDQTTKSEAENDS